MDSGIQKLRSFIIDNISEYNRLNWCYGKLNCQLKVLYLINMFDEIFKHIIENKIKCIGSISQNTILEKINEIESYGKVFKIEFTFPGIIFNQKLIKYKFMKLFGNIKSEEKKEYEELVEECNPVYTILVNKYRTKNLKKLPIELFRYLNEFL